MIRAGVERGWGGTEGCYSSGWDKDLWSGPRLKAASIPLPFSSKQRAHRTSQGKCFSLPQIPSNAKTDKRWSKALPHLVRASCEVGLYECRSRETFEVQIPSY